MNKYINADKLIAEIERYENTAINAYNPHGEDADFWNGKVVACEDLKTIITSLQQEQPDIENDIVGMNPSLPSNLDEAAKEYMRNYIPFDQCDSRDIIRTFKAGAEWLAGQGVTMEAVIGMATEEISINVSQQTLDKLNLCPGDKVVVQIRKKQ